MEHINEIREILNEYSKITAGINELERMTQLLNFRKTELETALDNNKNREKSLIDKIIEETGQAPDFYKIMSELNV
jgi:peptidoglycan hydrolase CwlO-like protein